MNENEFTELQYNNYKKFCLDNNIEPLSEEFFKNFNSDQDQAAEDKHVLQFKNVGIGINADSLYRAAKHGFRRFSENKGDIGKTVNTLKGDAGKFVSDVVNDFIGGSDDVKINTNINGGGGGFDSNSYQGNMSSPLGSSAVLITNLNRNPVEVKFDTGIAPRATYQLDLYPSSSYCPLHVSVCEPTLDNLSNDADMSNYVKNVIMFDLQNKGQAEINFALDTTNAFSSDNLVKLFSTQMYLLNTVFSILSIIGYSQDPMNRNLGLRNLRASISPDILNQVSIVMELIAGTPVPPNLMALCHWFNGNYNQTSLANSPAIKFLPVDPTQYSTQIKKRLDNGVARLQALRPTANLLARIVKTDKTWYSMPHYSSEILHDEEFTTLFSNAPMIVSGYITKPYSTNAAFNYISYGATDGGVLGMTTKNIGDTAETSKVYGLLSNGISTDGFNYKDTRYSVAVNSGDYVFVKSYTSTNFAFERGEAIVVYAETAPGVMTTTDAFVRFGSELLQQVSFNSVRENERQMIRHMVSIDKIKTKASMSKEGSKPKRSYGRKSSK